MRQSNEAILTDINSNNPLRIKTAIQDLKKRMNNGDEFEMMPFGPEILSSFGDTVPEETQIDFIEVLMIYRSFVPKLSDEDRIAAIIALVLLYAEHYVSFDVALKLKISENPVQSVETAMEEIARQGLLTPKNIKGASYLVSRLLDGKDEVRQATLQSLRKWPDETAYQEVIEYIKPQLEPDELLNQGV